MSQVPTMQEAFDTLAALAVVAPEHRDRMQRWEHGDFNDTDNTPNLAGTDRTILIGQLDAVATAVHELRHSPHLWASANAGIAIEQPAAPSQPVSVDGLREARAQCVKEIRAILDDRWPFGSSLMASIDRYAQAALAATSSDHGLDVRALGAAIEAHRARWFALNPDATHACRDLPDYDCTASIATEYAALAERAER